MPIKEKIYYCTLGDMVSDILYSDANYNQPILTVYDDELVQSLSVNPEILNEMYDRHCSICPFRFKCSLLESIHCEEDSDSFNTQIEICHTHFKEAYEKAWNDYVKDFD